MNLPKDILLRSYVLLQFEDKFLHVCPEKSIRYKYGIPYAPWNRKFYRAKILFVGSKRKMQVRLQNLLGTKKSRSSRFELTPKKKTKCPYTPRIHIERLHKVNDVSICSVADTEQENVVDSGDTDGSVDSYTYTKTSRHFKCRKQLKFLCYDTEDEAPLQPSLDTDRNQSTAHADTSITTEYSGDIDDKTSYLPTYSSFEQSDTQPLNFLTTSLVEQPDTLLLNAASSKREGKRKRHYCPFCRKLQFAFGRHVIQQHKIEADVKTIVALPKGSSERKKKLSLLRGKGMHMYNMNMSSDEKKIVVRNPKLNDKNIFVPCPNCNGYFLPRNVARHERRCTNRLPNRAQILPAAKEIQRQPATADQVLLHQLLSELRTDEVSDVVKNDKVLLLLASTMSVKYAKEKHLGNFMRQKLRQLARLLLKIRQIDADVTDFESCLIPERYNIVKRGIYELCELDPANFTYKRPSMAAQLGAMIKDCTQVLKVQNIKDGCRNSVQQQAIDDFLLIHKSEYGSFVAKSAITTLDENKWNKSQILPSIEDIQIFQSYLNLRAHDSYKILKTDFNYTEWLTLGKSCMLLLLTFNRRRVGEISRVLIKNFNNRQAIANDQYKSLTRLECILANNFQRVEIRGKRGRRVPLLLTNQHVKFVETFLKYRSYAGVNELNPFVFGVSHKKGYIDAGIAMREYSKKCGAAEPHTIRGTYLRKQVATISQLLNLNDNEIQQLADFMGHDVAIHRLHYRKPEINSQITRLSKFFMAAGGSDFEKYRGRTLDEIEVLEPTNETNEDSKTDCSISDGENENYTPKKNRNYGNLKLNVLKLVDSPIRRKVGQRKRWTVEERTVLREAFSNHLQNKTLPSVVECKKVRIKYANLLMHRRAEHIKAWVNNENKKFIRV